LQIAPHITKLNLSYSNITVDVLKDVLEGAPNIQTLDISDNNMGDGGILSLEEALSKSNSLKHLHMNRNFEKRTSQRMAALEALSRFVNTKPIESLYLQGGGKYFLKGDVVQFVLSLMTNRNLKILDVSRNNAGNTLAVALGKLVQTNSSLESLYWDDNGTNIIGFQVFRSGMARNRTLKMMPQPALDISNCIKLEKSALLLDTLNDIQKIVFSNAVRGKSIPSTSDVVKKETRKIDTTRASTIYGANVEDLIGSELTEQEKEELKRSVANVRKFSSAEDSVVSNKSRLRSDMSVGDFYGGSKTEGPDESRRRSHTVDSGELSIAIDKSVILKEEAAKNSPDKARIATNTGPPTTNQPPDKEKIATNTSPPTTNQPPVKAKLPPGAQPVLGPITGFPRKKTAVPAVKITQQGAVGGPPKKPPPPTPETKEIVAAPKETTVPASKETVPKEATVVKEATASKETTAPDVSKRRSSD